MLYCVYFWDQSTTVCEKQPVETGNSLPGAHVMKSNVMSC